MAKHEAPRHLSKGARDIWQALTTEYGIEDAGGLAILRVALEAWDRAQKARKNIEKNSMLIKGRDGQPKQHPLLCVERDARAAFLQGLKALNLDVMPENHRIGRPGGR